MLLHLLVINRVVKNYFESNTQFLKSFKKRKQCFFNDFTNCSLFIPMVEGLSLPISKYLDIFNKDGFDL